MGKKEILDNMLNQNSGVLLTRDAVTAGVSKTYFMNYVQKRNLEQVAMGIYLSPDEWLDSFYLLQIRYPEIIFSHETALYLLRMVERELLRFTVTAKAGYHAKSMTEQNIKVYRIKKELLEMGLITMESPSGHILRSYNTERTVCDLLRN